MCVCVCRMAEEVQNFIKLENIGKNIFQHLLKIEVPIYH